MKAGAPQFRIEQFGAEPVPVWVLDQALADPAAWLERASQVDFSPDAAGFYPGLRHFLDAGEGQALLARWQPLLPPGRRRCQALCYSIATTPGRALRPIQSLPHFDGAEADRLAMVLYLFDGEQGGTAFYRHRSSGYETVNGARLHNYRQSLRNQVRQAPEFIGRYMAGSNALFEQTGQVAARFNRALIYPANCLHSGLVANDRALSGDPRAGRLTLNFLLSCEPGES